MTIKQLLQNMYMDVKGLWNEDFSNFPNVLKDIHEFQNIDVEFIKDIRKEPIDGMIILKNILPSNFKSKIRLYSIYLDGEDVYYNISKKSLKQIK